MADKGIFDGVTLALLYLAQSRKKNRPTVRRTRTARQVLDKQGNVKTLYTETETIVEHK